MTLVVYKSEFHRKLNPDTEIGLWQWRMREELSVLEKRVRENEENGRLGLFKSGDHL